MNNGNGCPQRSKQWKATIERKGRTRYDPEQPLLQVVQNQQENKSSTEVFGVVAKFGTVLISIPEKSSCGKTQRGVVER